MTYKFTIITVCLNIASTIRRTCESIANQTYQNFEWIIVDGGSTDGTVKIIKDYAPRINLLISEPDKGIYNAMNKGIKLANGEYTNFMNGGDEFTAPNTLETVVKQGLTSDIIYGDEYKIENEESSICKSWDIITKDILFYRYGIAHQSVFTKTTILKKYLFNEKYIISADFDFFVKVFKKGYKFTKIPVIINKFYVDGISSKNRDLCSKEYKEIRRNHFKIKSYINEHDKIKNLLEFLYNSIRYPRYFAGWVKRLIIKQK